MAVLTLAMVRQAVDLARLPPSRARVEVTERELVTAERPDAPGASSAPRPARRGARARWGGCPKAAGIAWSLPLCGTLFTVAGVVLRALKEHRWPLGDMYEFPSSAACSPSAYSG